MAVTAAQYINAVDRLIALRNSLNLNSNQIKELQYSVRSQIEALQDLALAGDATAQLYLNAKRGFMTNPTGGPVSVRFNGEIFTIPDAEVDCMDLDEVRFFVENGAGLAKTDLGTYIATPGVQRTFFW